jgi:hypothetical protein
MCCYRRLCQIVLLTPRHSLSLHPQQPHPRACHQMKRKSRLLGGSSSSSVPSAGSSASASSSQNPLLKAAAKADKKAVATALKSLPCNAVAVIDEQGRTALHIAASVTSDKAEKLLRFVIEKTGSDLLEAVDFLGDTPLHAAAASGSADNVGALLDGAESTGMMRSYTQSRSWCDTMNPMW